MAAVQAVGPYVGAVSEHSGREGCACLVVAADPLEEERLAQERARGAHAREGRGELVAYCGIVVLTLKDGPARHLVELLLARGQELDCASATRCCWAYGHLGAGEQRAHHQHAGREHGGCRRVAVPDTPTCKGTAGIHPGAPKSSESRQRHRPATLSARTRTSQIALSRRTFQSCSSRPRSSHSSLGRRPTPLAPPCARLSPRARPTSTWRSACFTPRPPVRGTATVSCAASGAECCLAPIVCLRCALRHSLLRAQYTLQRVREVRGHGAWGGGWR